MNNIVFISLTEDELRAIVSEAVKQVIETKKEKELLNFREACEFLGCSASFLNKSKAENKVPYLKLGKRVFFSKAELKSALEESNYFKLRDI